MKPYELRNYGKSVAEMNRLVPREVFLQIRKDSMKVLKKHMSFFKRFKMARIMRKERKRFMYANLFEVKEKGMKDDRFIMSVVGKAAYFSALTKTVGVEKAIEIDKDLTKYSADLRMEYMMPPAEEWEKVDDPFAALKEWVIAFWKGNRGANIFQHEIVEDSEKALQVNCTYCAFAKIGEVVEEQKSTYSFCYFDDLRFSHLEKAGIKYTRSKALANGDKCCDFRFEKV
jgi:hypothetical protein